MAYRIMPTPTAEPYTSKNKKNNQKQTNGVTNTVTPPPQPKETLQVKNNYQQPVSKAETAVTKNTYNPLTLNQSASATKPTSAMDSIYSKPTIYDSTPIPGTQLKSNKPQGYSSTPAPKQPKADTVTKPTVPKTNYGPNKEAAYSMPTATYKPQTRNSATDIYTTKDRVGSGYTLPAQTKAQKPVAADRFNRQNSANSGAWGVPKTIKDGAAPQISDNLFKNLFNNKTVDDWGVPKTIKDGAQPKVVQSDVFNNNVQNYGINREMAQYMPTGDDILKELYIEYLKKGFTESVGKSNEIAQTNFLDHKGQNPVEKFVEQNSFKGLDSSPVVTKDNVYDQTPEKIQTQLNDTGKMVSGKISDLKREREDLMFEVQYGRRDKNDEQLQKVNYDIQYLQHIQKKIELGLKYQYVFAQEELNDLSQANIDDIMNSKEKYGKTLPIYEPYADALKTINKGYSNYQNSVGVIDNIKVEYNDEGDIFKIFDKNNPQNSFEFSTELEFNPKGYYEYIIKANKDAAKTAEYVQYDLLKAIDGKAVSKSTIDKLVDIAKENGKSASKLFDNVGYFLDFADFWIIMDSDKEFNNGEVGVDTYKAGGEFLGSVMGDKLGGIAGAKAGAAIGTAAFGPIGTVVGSVLGAAAGAYLLSSAMEEIGGYWGEEIYEQQSTDSTQQHYQYYERAR